MIRFKNMGMEFPKPEIVKLGNHTKQYKIRNRKQLPLEIYSVNNEVGFLPQTEQFEEAGYLDGADTSIYMIVPPKHFAYNPARIDVGSIGYQNLDKEVQVSSLYEVFSTDEKINDKYLWYWFHTDYFKKLVLKYQEGGVRQYYYYDKLELADIKLPSIKEQKKIAEFFSLVDEKINIQDKRLKTLEERKKGLLQHIFSQEIRFKNDDGSEFPDWEEQLLSDILIERKEKSTGKEEVYSVSVSKGLVNQIEHLGRSYAAEDTSKYKIIRPGDVVYTKSPTGDFKWGIVKQSMIDKKVIVSPLYGIFIPKSEAFGFILDAYFSSSVRAHNYLITQIRKGAKNTINITNDVFLEKEILLPTSDNECKKIKKFVKLLDEQIRIEKDKLESIKQIKKGLLQQMFI